MKEDNDDLDGRLMRCSGSFVTFYYDSPAEGAHMYSNIAYIVVNVVFSILGTFLNVLVVTVYWKNQTLRSSSNMLFAVLASSDLMVNSIVQPLLVTRMLMEVFGSYNCILWTSARLTSYFCCGVSLLTIAIICIERFITLAYPYRYQTILSPFRIKIVVASTWLAIFVLVLGHLGPISFTILASVGASLIFISVAIVFLTWIWIRKLVHRHRNAIELTQMPTEMQNEIRNQRKVVFRTTNTCYMIVASVFSFYFPSLIILGYNAIVADNGNFVVLFLISPWVETIMFANSVLNPVILFWRKEAFREIAKATLF